MSWLLRAPRFYLSSWMLYRLSQPAPRWAHHALVALFWLVVALAGAAFFAGLVSQ